MTAPHRVLIANLLIGISVWYRPHASTFVIEGFRYTIDKPRAYTLTGPIVRYRVKIA